MNSDRQTREQQINNQRRKHVGFPTMTARENWGRYLAGMGTEVLYALFLYACGLVLAFIAMALYR